jgi:hypothetical protein
MACIEKEYPNKLGQVLGGEKDLQSPKVLHPVFYGCFDWHSSVHAHWSLIKLLKNYPTLPERLAIIEHFDATFTNANIAREIDFFKDENKSFERTYGWAWIFKLSAELHSWKDPNAQRWSQALAPLTEMLAKKMKDFLPKLDFPIRSGEHPNTAFGLALSWDYALEFNDKALQELIIERSKYYYGKDRNCPVTWEPSGYDFISPCLQEAALMKRILPISEFEQWRKNFIPGFDFKPERMYYPVGVSDRTDGKLVHLDGLNFNRAWCLSEMSKGVSYEPRLSKLAQTHFNASIVELKSGEYAGEHWLASFALYALEASGRIK